MTSGSDRPFWSTTETLTWIAFRRPETWATCEQRGAAFYDRWKVLPTQAHDMLALLTMRAGFENPWKRRAGLQGFYPIVKDDRAPSGFSSPFASPDGPAQVREVRRRHRLGAENPAKISFGMLREMMAAELAELEERQAAMSNANRRLVEAIGDNRLSALGKPFRDQCAPRSPIPRDLAADPVLFRADRLDLVPKTEEELRKHGPARTLFVDVVFRANEVRSVFPALPQPAATSGDEARLQEWLESEMRASPAVSPGKKAMRAKAIEAKHKFSGEGFKRTWIAAVTATGAIAWSNPGRKSTGVNRRAK